VGLFDLQPKCRREDLFDRERELSELHRAVERGYPLVALLGVRRIGKTSILKTFLNEICGIYVDMRGVIRRADLELKVADALSSSLDRVRRLLEGVRGIEIAGFSIEIRWRGRDSISLAGLLSEVNKKSERFVLALDEVQVVKPPLSAELRNLLSYAYDNLENITFIVAGSEIGMLREFLGYEKPSSPLYGRYIYEIPVERFSRDEARVFLEKGFREEGVKTPTDAIDSAVEFFEGIVGWLVFFGRRYIDGYRDLETLKGMAVELAQEELSKLSSREKMVLKAVALGCNSWSKVRAYIAERYGITVPKATLTRILAKLEKMSIVKNYEFQDPTYREASKRLTL
jgi:AAA+ ATPase superfamily predicted ATPase